MKLVYQGNEVGEIHKNQTAFDIYGEEIKTSPDKIIACRCNNEIRALDYTFKEGDNVELIDLKDSDGMKVYIRGVLYLMAMAFHELYPKALLVINYQLFNAMFCEVDNIAITDEMLQNVKKKMIEISKENIPITKKEMTKEEAHDFYSKERTLRGILQLHNNSKDEVSLYFCKDYFNYFYGVMPISTNYIDLFEIEKHKNGFIVRYPDKHNPSVVGDFKDNKKFLAALQEYDEIFEVMGIRTTYKVNKIIEEGKTKDLILMSEALHEKKIAQIADRILRRPSVRLILIAGPSSSGKTTFAKRLGMQLRVNGLKPVTIGTDNYFVERVDNPRDENGDYDFETIDALDLTLFNEHLTKLINGETINVPTFDFKEGTKKYYDDKTMHLAKDEVLIIEGIHCLNKKLTASIPNDEKFKIYISDLTVLNIDYFNRISTTDTRLVRRIVRDYNYREYSALDTLKRWPSVNCGERKNIFPYQEEADVMYNSSLVYEHNVLGKYAIPLLDAIPNSEREYSEAKRLSSFLKYFTPIENEEIIPNNSLLREFIGGSVFDY